VVLTRFGARSDGTREGNQILVPVGFAHGFCTLEPDTEVFYKVSAPYSPEHDRGVSWIDKDIAIDWPVAPADAVLSAKDLALPALAGLPDCFLSEPMDSER
jgi:dTDP-4-dehydrorhamnose 3,5-epimerase